MDNFGFTKDIFHLPKCHILRLAYDLNIDFCNQKKV